MSLRISIDKQCPFASPGELDREINGGRSLAHPARHVHDADCLHLSSNLSSVVSLMLYALITQARGRNVFMLL
jgi:hypothetical protein